MKTKYLIFFVACIILNVNPGYSQILKALKQKVSEGIEKKIDDFEVGRKNEKVENQSRDTEIVVKPTTNEGNPPQVNSEKDMKSLPPRDHPIETEDKMSTFEIIRYDSPNNKFKPILLASHKDQPRFGSISRGLNNDVNRKFSSKEYSLLGMERFLSLIEYKYLYDLLEDMDKEQFMSSLKEGTAEEFQQYFIQQYIKETMASHLENSFRYLYFCNSKKYDCDMTNGKYSDFDHAKEWGGDSEDIFRIRQTYLNFVKEDYLIDFYKWASTFMQEGEEYYFVSESRLKEYDFNKEAFEFHLSLPHGGGLSDIAPKYSVFRFSNTIFPDDHTFTKCSLPLSIDEAEKIYELHGGRSNISGKTIPIYVVYKMRLKIKEVNLKVSAQNQKPRLVFDVSMVDDEVDVFFDEKLNNKVGTLNLLDHVN